MCDQAVNKSESILNLILNCRPNRVVKENSSEGSMIKANHKEIQFTKWTGLCGEQTGGNKPPVTRKVFWSERRGMTQEQNAQSTVGFEEEPFNVPRPAFSAKQK